MVPANRVEPYGNHDDKFYAELDKERLEMLPEFNDETMKAQGDWSTYEKDYEKRWNDGAVMYNKDSGRIITPAHIEGEGLNPVMGGASASASGRRLDLKPEKVGKEDDLLGVASGVSKTTLRPKKPSIGGREDVEMMRREREPREVMNPIGEELEIPREEPGVRSEAMRSDAVRSEVIGEPGVYKLDPIVETEQGAGPAERLADLDRGRRWNEFQQNLRNRRNKIIVDCPDCASQDKAA